MSVTIKDIAKQAGVSIATVSRVLNHLGGYSSEVEQKILEIANELGYRRNANAMSLVSKSTRTIGIIMPTVATSYYGNIVSGIEDVAHQNGYSVILSHAGVSGNRLHNSLNVLSERRVDGVLIFSLPFDQEDIDRIKALGIPVMLISTEVEEGQMPYIKVDDYKASYTAVEYFIGLGHRNIAIVGASSTDPIAGLPRIRGYLDAMKNHSLEVQDDWICYGDFTFEAGQMGMRQLLQAQEQVTAIFCVSDEVALGVNSICYEHHLAIPDDVSIIGYDNTVARMGIPPITTIAQPFYEMGQLGCKSLIQSIQTSSNMESQLIPFKLIERASVKDNHLGR
ncbi:LacI family DNA-binding transcriptional regulator [Streptococcus cuniculi]|uniref:LacI family transcriptional regulator n=1 Tax=Streptococcus cuniculi TaxID=1432788 RepID=A0A4Y9JBX5_9STRE|nr:LacI family DNA-binding transcriptional regulator [Streptococcus cuniculi]MBF0777699.1 LacI family DNA-binding transcriptional regulator [Streptococcus cuniculi]TFU98337.1 LacI family transcriptional regulator [Streptococcus cuniculi]